MKETPVIDVGQNSSATNTGNAQFCVKWEINVSRNGKHVFATDSTIRNYSKSDIAKLIELFKEKFPDCKVEASGKQITGIPFVFISGSDPAG